MKETFNPTQEKVPNKQEIAKQELNDFFSAFPEEDEANTYRRGMFENIFEKDPDSIQKIAESTKDSREVWQKLRERAWNTLEKIDKDIVWVNDFSESFGLVTKEGKEKAEEESQPEILTNAEGDNIVDIPAKYKKIQPSFDTFEQLNEYLLIKHQFDGLNKEEINEIVEAEEDFVDANSLYSQIGYQLRGMIYNRHIKVLGDKHKDNEETLDKALAPILDTINDLSYNKKLVRSQIYGKLQKLRYTPRFLGDNVDDFVNDLKQDLKNLFSKEKEN